MAGTTLSMVRNVQDSQIPGLNAELAIRQETG